MMGLFMSILTCMILIRYVLFLSLVMFCVLYAGVRQGCLVILKFYSNGVYHNPLKIIIVFFSLEVLHLFSYTFGVWKSITII